MPRLCGSRFRAVLAHSNHNATSGSYLLQAVYSPHQPLERPQGGLQLERRVTRPAHFYVTLSAARLGRPRL